MRYALLLLFIVACTQVSIMNITSPAFKNNALIPLKYTCQGRNVNPPLHIEGIPQNAETLVLLMDDPDAPMGVFDHWVVWNIPPMKEIAENSTPEDASEGVNGANKTGYLGPCPPSGTHRYFFKLYALDTSLHLSGNATKKDVEHAMQGHIVGQAQLIGLYQKQA